MSTLRIRRYRPSDADAVRSLDRETLRDAGTDPEALPDTSDLEDPREHYVEEGGEFLLALCDGDVAGMGGVRPVEGRTAELKRMRVAPAAQGAGIGSAILERLEAHAKAGGFDRLVLDTAARQDAVPFYRAHGYEETGRREWNGFELVDLEKEL